MMTWFRFCLLLTLHEMKDKDINTYFAHIENLLNNPAVVSLQCLLVGFGDIDPDQVGVVLIPVPLCQTLQQDLYETETPAGETRYLAAEVSTNTQVHQGFTF